MCLHAVEDFAKLHTSLLHSDAGATAEVQAAGCGMPTPPGAANHPCSVKSTKQPTKGCSVCGAIPCQSTAAGPSAQCHFHTAVSTYSGRAQEGT